MKKQGSLNDLWWNSYIDKDFEAELDASGNYLYIGFAEPGTAVTDSKWQIFKLSYTNASFPNTPTAMRYANGNDDFIFVWNNRQTYTYIT